jgi:hypothetical protein
MKSFMTMFATANARRMRIGLVGLAAMAIATIIGTSLASAPLFSVRLPQASPAVSANSYAPLDQHERHAAASIDAKARATGFYYTTQNAVAAPAPAATSIDEQARATGYYYTTQIMDR